MLIWLDEAHLRHVVIFDPIRYFIVPATIIVRNLRQSSNDVSHESELHKRCSREHSNDYDDLKNGGILSYALLVALLNNALLEEYESSHREVVSLMLKFGLLVSVPILCEAAKPSGDTFADIARAFIVPALLPDAPKTLISVDGKSGLLQASVST